ncbi:MAG: fructosamine kinase family protein [Lysobacterales bacterium]
MPPDFLAALCRKLGLHQDDLVVTPVNGGDINTAVTLISPKERLFVKYGGVDADAFGAESDGLEALYEAADEGDGALQIPRPIAYGELCGRAFLAMECLQIRPKSQHSDSAMGRGLAQIHARRRATFGWHRNNRIGATRQPNPPNSHWVDFFLQHRLLHQATLLGDPQVLRELDNISRNADQLFDRFQPFPSLLHGDLWGGNYAAVGHRAAMFDPACYHGCRETDVAMTELFGGFGPAFFASYNQALALDPGYPRRRPLYQLYHLLNHANLFGGSYISQSLDQLDVIARTIAEASG